MLGKCERCGRIKSTRLPSGHNNRWLDSVEIPIKWYCANCYWYLHLNGNAKPGDVIEQVIVHRYLIKTYEVIPFLASIAVIIMVCLEIAWHT
jgi:hypothetical protein